MKTSFAEFSFETIDNEAYEIVYDVHTGQLVEVRMFSHRFNDYIPLQFSYMAQYPTKMAYFLNKVQEQIAAGEALAEERRNLKEYDNDDNFPNDAA